MTVKIAVAVYIIWTVNHNHHKESELPKHSLRLALFGCIYYSVSSPSIFSQSSKDFLKMRIMLPMRIVLNNPELASLQAEARPIPRMATMSFTVYVLLWGVPFSLVLIKLSPFANAILKCSLEVLYIKEFILF